MNYHSQTMVKGKTFANFIVEFTYFDTTEVDGTVDYTEAVKEVEMEKGITSAVG